MNGGAAVVVRRIGAVAVALVLLAVALVGCGGGGGSWAENRGVPVSEDSFPGEPWGRDLLREQNNPKMTERNDRYGWRLADQEGKYNNVRDSVRVTLQVDDPAVTIWFFGGSTMQGIGQRDEHTIPSDIVRLAKESGFRVEAVNYGVSAWVNSQETMLFADELERGPAPDIAVFLDGTNDFGLGFERIRFGELDGSVDVRLLVDQEDQKARAAELEAEGYVASTDPDLPLQLAAQQYRRGVLAAQGLAREHDVELVNFWQPQLISASGGRPYLPDVPENASISEESIQTGPEAVRAVAEQSGVAPIDLSGVYDGMDEPLYFDGAHTNERGARILAAAMWETLRPLVAKAAGP